MDINKPTNKKDTLKAESLQNNFLKIQIEKNFSTGNINLLEDVNENEIENDNEFSFNDDLNSLSSFEADLTNSINSSPNNDQQSSQDQPEILFVLDDSSTQSFDTDNRESTVDSTIAHDELENEEVEENLDDSLNLSHKENEEEEENQTEKDTLHFNNININSQTNNNYTINDFSPQNKDKYSSLMKKNLIPKELKGITGSFSSLIYNELTKSLNNQRYHDNSEALGSTEYLDNDSSYDSSLYSPNSVSSLINSPHTPKSPNNCSHNSSKLSLNQISSTITEKTSSPSTNLTKSPIDQEEQKEENTNNHYKQDSTTPTAPSPKIDKEKENSTDNKNKNSQKEENKKRKKLTIKKDVLTDKELDGFHRWVLCFCIVNFDLEVGQAIEYIYPPTDLTEEEKKNVSFSAFPDSNSSSHKGNSIFCFRMKSGPSTEKLYHHQHHFSPISLMKKEDEQFNGGTLANPEKYRKDLKIDVDGYLYGYVFFRQQKDPTNKRGYFQKSFVLLSPHPFKGLFMKIVEKLGLLYFSSLKIGQTVEDQILIQKRQKNLSYVHCLYQ